jgi:xanthine phosphoribosyltransferase
MQLLEERIRHDAKHLGNGVIKVDSFMNHQIDPELMRSIGEEFARLFQKQAPTRILTAETSGIAPALAAGMFLKIPIVFARKHQPITMAADPFRETSTSPTHGKQVELLVSPEYLKNTDRVLIIDDFLASAKTISSLVHIVEKSGATLVGIGAVIEKSYGKGREVLSSVKVPIESLAVITSYDGDKVIVGSGDKVGCP